MKHNTHNSVNLHCFNGFVCCSSYGGGGTDTAGALSFVRTDILTPGHGDRADVQNVVFVFTDGVSSSSSRTATEATLLKTIAHKVNDLVDYKHQHLKYTLHFPHFPHLATLDTVEQTHISVTKITCTKTKSFR